MKIRFELLLSVFVLAIAAMLLVPLPTALIDILIVLNLAFSFLILLISLYLPNALSLLSFPTLLLLSTLFRLALNVASSRLILAQGDAGVVIEAFGTLLVGGQVAVGIIVFTIITVVNFLVIARGSARVSEVAARFALDAMPGKQATIDSDLRAGLISSAQANQRREALRKESQLYGAMDGSMKFVQGDAIAGFLIILTNIIGGLSIAVGDGMPVAEAFQTYTILTVGDGLVAQVPALLIAICAGIVVTRVSSTDTSTLGEDVAADLFAKPSIVIAVGGLLAALAMLPGVPALPFLAVGATLAFVGYRLRTGNKFGLASSAAALNAAGPATAERGFQKVLGSGAGGGAVAVGDARRLLLSAGAGADAVPGVVNRSAGVKVAPSGVRLKILLDRHALFSSFERDLGAAYGRWRDIQVAIEAELGVQFPELWIGADVRSSSGSVSVELDGINLARLSVPLDAQVVLIEPSHARALGLSVVAECLDPLSGKVLSWISNRFASRGEPFGKFDAIDIAMRHAAHYLLSHPEDLVSIADTHATLTNLEKDYPGLFDSSLDRRFVNPARATEIKRELLRAGIAVGDTRQLIEDLAHYCATYAKSELTASDFDLSDIVMHIRRLRLRHLAGAIRNESDDPPVMAAIRLDSNSSPASGAGGDTWSRDILSATRSGIRPLCGLLSDDGFVNQARSLAGQLPHMIWLSEGEATAAELKSVHVAFVGSTVQGWERPSSVSAAASIPAVAPGSIGSE